MELIYSTSDLEHARRLALALSEAGVSNHVSGTNSARLTGFLAARTPSAIGVWVASSSDLPRARELMQAHGYIPPPAAPPPVAKHNRAWLIIIGAILIVGLALLLSGGP